LVLIGTSDLELVLAAYTVVLAAGVTLAVTTFWLYSGASPALQSGELHVAVMLAVPPETAVTVAVSDELVDASTVATAVEEDPQVSVGAIDFPALSTTSAVTLWVFGGVSEKDVCEPLVSCTDMLATAHVV
jgi:hypothetical protein